RALGGGGELGEEVVVAVEAEGELRAAECDGAAGQVAADQLRQRQVGVHGRDDGPRRCPVGRTLLEELQVVEATAGEADVEAADADRSAGRLLNLGGDLVGRKPRPE